MTTGRPTGPWNGWTREPQDLSTLWEHVLERHVKPEDVYEVVAILESDGWNDARVQERFGFANVFELAHTLWELRGPSAGVTANEYMERQPLVSAMVDAVRQFLRGAIFAMPMVLSTFSMLFLHFSLWSYINLPVSQATAITMGTVLSFITAGGFMQVIARRGFFYIYQDYYRLARRMTFLVIGIGVITSLLISGLLFVFDMMFPVLPYSMMGIMVAYYLVLNAIWLSVTTLYILKIEILSTGLLAFGIVLVLIGYTKLKMNILMAQLLAMLVIAVLALLLGRYFFRHRQKERERGIRPVFPRPAVTVHSVLPYFLYGGLYFGLLFCDRIMAWSSYSSAMPYVVWVRGDYELGLDFALTALIFPMGVLEVVVTRIMNGLLYAQRRYGITQVTQMNRSYIRRYFRSLALMAVMSLLSSASVYIVVQWLFNHPSALSEQMRLSVNGLRVFVLALISNTVLAVSMLNVVLMFALSRPDLVLRPLVQALTVDAAVGLCLTRWFQYMDAVWGLFTGVTVFMAATTYHVFRVLRNLDYHLYLLS